MLERLLAGVEAELLLHSGLAARWDLRLEHAVPVPATEAYVALLTGVCACPSASLADCLSVMIPCLRLYAWLAQQLQLAAATPGSNPYQGARTCARACVHGRAGVWRGACRVTRVQGTSLATTPVQPLDVAGCHGAPARWIAMGDPSTP